MALLVPRKEIRDEVVALLVAHTDAETNVLASRDEAIGLAEEEALVVYTRSDPTDERSKAPRTYWRDLELIVSAFARGKPAQGLSHDDRLDQLIGQVEALLLPAIGALAEEHGLDRGRTRYEGVEIDFDAEGRPVVGDAQMRFVFSYVQSVDEIDPADLEDLRTIRVEADVEPADQTIDLVDDIEIEQG